MYSFAEYANQCNTLSKAKLFTYFYLLCLLICLINFLTLFTYLLIYFTYLLTYFMRDVRDPGFWARTPAGYDYNVYLEYLVILYLLN